MWTGIHSRDRVAGVREEDATGAPSPRQWCAEGGDRRYSCLDAEVFDTRAVGEGEGKGGLRVEPNLNGGG